jgi:hypothetical protein
MMLLRMRLLEAEAVEAASLPEHIRFSSTSTKAAQEVSQPPPPFDRLIRLTF